MIIARGVSIVFFALLLSSCALSVTPSMTEKDVLKSDEAVLLVRTHGVDVGAGQLRVGEKNAQMFDGPLANLSVTSGEQLLLVKVKSKRNMSLYSYASERISVWIGQKDYTFEAEPGTITYIGDIYIAEKISTEFFAKHKKYIIFSVKDREKQTVAMAKKRAPWLFRRYPYKKSIVKNAPGYKMSFQRKLNQSLLEAEAQLTETQVQSKSTVKKKQGNEKGYWEIFAGSTFSGKHTKKGFQFKSYFSDDGRLIEVRGNGKRKEGNWTMSESGYLCIIWENNKGCGQIEPNGSGSYNFLRKGEVRRNYRLIKKGNALY